MQDEVFFVHDVIIGHKYWSLVGHPVNMSYTSRHKRIVAYGSITGDCR